MSYQNTEPISKKLTLLVGLPIVGIMAFSLFYSFYQNLLFQKRLDELEKKNMGIAQDIEQGYRDLEYYRSSQYRDKIAKESLNLSNPEEKVLILSKGRESINLSPYSSFLISPTQHQEAAFRELLRQMPVIEHWRFYLFYRERIEEMKRSL
jgi:hypothetical protein